GLPPVKIGEELDALKGGQGIAWGRAGRWRLATGLPSGDGAALQEVERPILEGPLDVTPRAVNLLALQGELAQRGELGVVEANLVHLRGRHLLLEGAAVRERADRDALAAGLALQHLAGAVEAEVVRDVNGGRPDGKRRRQGSDGLRQLFNGLVVPRGDGLDQVTRQRDAGGDRETLARGVAQSNGLGSKERSLAGFREGDDLFHFYPSIVTSPASPSTRTRTPSAMRSVASRVPTTPGMPYSREMIAACERRPPASVTIPPRSGRRMLKASVVDSVTSTSPLAIRPNWEGPETRRAGPSYTPLLAASPWR